MFPEEIYFLIYKTSLTPPGNCRDNLKSIHPIVNSASSTLNSLFKWFPLCRSKFPSPTLLPDEEVTTPSLFVPSPSQHPQCHQNHVVFCHSISQLHLLSASPLVQWFKPPLTLPRLGHISYAYIYPPSGAGLPNSPNHLPHLRQGKIYTMFDCVSPKQWSLCVSSILRGPLSRHSGHERLSTCWHQQPCLLLRLFLTSSVPDSLWSPGSLCVIHLHPCLPSVCLTPISLPRSQSAHLFLQVTCPRVPITYPATITHHRSTTACGRQRLHCRQVSRAPVNIGPLCLAVSCSERQLLRQYGVKAGQSGFHRPTRGDS